MTEAKTKYCPHCGAQIDYKYSVCPACGKPQAVAPGVEVFRKPQRKNPLLALVLSLLITGVGQIYLGKVWRGLAFLGGIIILGSILESYLNFDQVMIVGVVISIISAYDAYILAKKINARDEF